MIENGVDTGQLIKYRNKTLLIKSSFLVGNL